MELWIRSQDKRSLTKVRSIHILEDVNLITIHGYINDKNHFWLGTYETKERALEVLNEIQDILSPKITIKSGVKDIMEQGRNIFEPTIKLYENNSIQELNSYVYEMPKE